MDTFYDLFKTMLDRDQIAYIETNDNFHPETSDLIADYVREADIKFIISLPISAALPDDGDLSAIQALLVHTIEKDGSLAGQDVVLVNEDHRGWSVFLALVKLQDALDVVFFDKEETVEVVGPKCTVKFDDGTIGAFVPGGEVLTNTDEKNANARRSDKSVFKELLEQMKERSSFEYDISEDDDGDIVLSINEFGENNEVMFLFSKSGDLLDAVVSG